MSEERPEYNIEKIKRDNAILRKYAVIQKAAEDKIGCQKIYIDISEDIEAAFVLDELIYFTLPRENTGKSALRVWKDGVLWMAVRRAEWWDRKRLTPRQADRAIEKLKEKNLILTSVHKFNGQNTVHIRLNVDEFFRKYTEIVENANPPEEQTESVSRNINDLYEMMGISRLPNGELPNGDGRLPFGDTGLPNGEIINNPHTTLTQPQTASPLSQESWYQFEKVAQEHQCEVWEGRETFAPQHYPLVDWYHKVTGQSCPKSKRRDWMRAVGMWAANGLTVENLQAAYDMDLKWRGVFTSPNQLTDKAIALKAQRKARPVEITELL